MAGKGDTPRPVDRKKYDENYDNIFNRGFVVPKKEEKKEEKVGIKDEYGWEGMETAPKNGVRILLFYPDLFSNPTVLIGRWDVDGYSKKPRPYWSGDHEQYTGKTELREHLPTRWQRLPPNPE